MTTGATAAGAQLDCSSRACEARSSCAASSSRCRSAAVSWPLRRFMSASSAALGALAGAGLALSCPSCRKEKKTQSSVGALQGPANRIKNHHVKPYLRLKHGHHVPQLAQLLLMTTLHPPTHQRRPCTPDEDDVQRVEHGKLPADLLLLALPLLPLQLALRKPHRNLSLQGEPLPTVVVPFLLQGSTKRKPFSCTTSGAAETTKQRRTPAASAASR